MRNLDEVTISNATKLMWRFRQRVILWASYLQSNYCNSTHPTVIQFSPSLSASWKRILEAKEHVEPHITWNVGKGNIDAHNDKQCDATVMQSSSNVILKSCFDINSLPDEFSFRKHLGQEALDETKIKNISLSSHEDTCAWDITFAGTF